MDENQKRIITINIYENKIPVRINPDEEELYRKAESALKGMLNEFANTFVGKGRETILCCAAYELMFYKLKDAAEYEQLTKTLDQTL